MKRMLHKRIYLSTAVLMSFMLLAALAPCASFADEAPKATPATFSGYYTFVTASGNAIALKSDSIKDGAAMVLKPNTKNSVGRQFFLDPHKNGYHAISNSISFKALSVKGASKNEGARLVQSVYKKTKGQRFQFVASGDDGWYFVKSALGTYVAAKSDIPKTKLSMTGDITKALKLRIEKTEYSTGNRKLDSKLKKLRKKIGGGDKLKKSFNYVVKNFAYLDHENNFKGDWIVRYAWHMVSKKNGHCKNYAATLCLLYRSYGYEARVVSGFLQSQSRGWVVHGWVEAKVKGKTYIFDPSMANHYGVKSWYKRTYANAITEYRIEKRW